MQIDFTYLETLSDGDMDFITQFVSTFEETVDSLTMKLKAEFDAGDFKNLGKSAHQLKPSAKMLGLISGETLEELQENPSAATVDMLDEVEKDCKAGLTGLKEWAKEQGAEV